MKYFNFLFILFSMIACNSSQKLTKEIPREMQNISCPGSGNCSIEVFKNSSLQIKTDAFGKIYPKIQKGNNLVVKYHFEKKEKKNIEDAGYSEFIYFEVDKNEKQIILKDAELQKLKILYGRICFCRDANGYFRVDQGNLYLFNNNNNLQFNLKFDMGKIPQVITQINENIKY